MAQESHDRLAYGTAALVAEILIAMVIATFVKFVTDDVSVAVLLLFRYVFCLPVLLGLGCLESGARLFRLANRRALALRTLFGLAGLTCWIVAIANIELTKATAVSQTLPVFITFFAPFLLGERVGLRRWVAVLIGLSGTLIILRPDQEGWLQTGTAAAIAAPFFAALMFIYLRKLGQSDAPSTTAIYYNFAGTCVFSAWCLAMPVSWPQSASDVTMLVGCGLLAGIQQFLMALSHKLAPASALAPLHYLTVPLAIGIGVILFDETLSASFLLGTGIIVVSTYYILVRERKIRGRAKH